MTTERIVMSVDNFDSEDAIVVNFDVYDLEEDAVTQVGGYVQVRQLKDEFRVLIFDVEGDVLSETSVPFNFKNVEDI